MRALNDHIAATYLMLRIGIAAFGIALPFILGLGGALAAGLVLQESMSAYYHAGDGALRNQFVGVLCAIGAGLYLYRGYTFLEDWALNFAGVFLVAVAWRPMPWPPSGTFTLSAHYVFAMIFFLLIAYVCIFRAPDTLSLIRDPDVRKRYRRTYRVLGLLMVLAPIAAVVLASANFRTFFVETAGVLVFGAYWIVKSVEIRRTSVDHHAMAGRLTTRPYTVRDAFKPIPVQSLGGEVLERIAPPSTRRQNAAA